MISTLSGSIQLTSFGYEASIHIHLNSGDTATITAYHEDNPHKAAEFVQEAVGNLIDEQAVKLTFYMDEPGWQPHEGYLTLNA